ncbi:Glycine cleavage system P protein, partial [Caligus rogercresseyi]
QNKRLKFFLSDKLHPQTISCVKTRAEPFGIELDVGNVFEADFSKKEYSGVLFQYPDTEGSINDFQDVIQRARPTGSPPMCKIRISLYLTDYDSLCDRLDGFGDTKASRGLCQRFGVPLFYGGPHAGFFATQTKYVRLMPGRMVGVTRDVDDKHCYRLALQLGSSTFAGTRPLATYARLKLSSPISPLWYKGNIPTDSLRVATSCRGLRESGMKWRMRCILILSNPSSPRSLR